MPLLWGVRTRWKGWSSVLLVARMLEGAGTPMLVALEKWTARDRPLEPAPYAAVGGMTALFACMSHAVLYVPGRLEDGVVYELFRAREGIPRRITTEVIAQAERAALAEPVVIDSGDGMIATDGDSLRVHLSYAHVSPLVLCGFSQAASVVEDLIASVSGEDLPTIVAAPTALIERFSGSDRVLIPGSTTEAIDLLRGARPAPGKVCLVRGEYFLHATLLEALIKPSWRHMVRSLPPAIQADMTQVAFMLNMIRDNTYVPPTTHTDPAYVSLRVGRVLGSTVLAHMDNVPIKRVVSFYPAHAPALVFVLRGLSPSAPLWIVAERTDHAGRLSVVSVTGRDMAGGGHHLMQRLCTDPVRCVAYDTEPDARVRVPIRWVEATDAEKLLTATSGSAPCTPVLLAHGKVIQEVRRVTHVAPSPSAVVQRMIDHLASEETSAAADLARVQAQVVELCAMDVTADHMLATFLRGAQQNLLEQTMAQQPDLERRAAQATRRREVFEGNRDELVARLRDPEATCMACMAEPPVSVTVCSHLLCATCLGRGLSRQQCPTCRTELVQRGHDSCVALRGCDGAEAESKAESPHLAMVEAIRSWAGACPGAGFRTIVLADKIPTLHPNLRRVCAGLGVQVKLMRGDPPQWTRNDDVLFCGVAPRRVLSQWVWAARGAHSVEMLLLEGSVMEDAFHALSHGDVESHDAGDGPLRLPAGMVLVPGQGLEGLERLMTGGGNTGQGAAALFDVLRGMLEGVDEDEDED